VDGALQVIQRLLAGCPLADKAALLTKVREIAGRMLGEQEPPTPAVGVEPAMDADPNWARLRALRQAQQAQLAQDRAAWLR
jgi:hypothetical protein